MGDYRSLKVWQSAHRLSLGVYHTTTGYPRHEIYGLTSQGRRAASSIAANLAEGSGRNSPREMARFARVSLGSANELDYHLLLAHDLGYLSDQDHDQLEEQVDHLRRMLANFIRSIDASGG